MCGTPAVLHALYETNDLHPYVPPTPLQRDIATLIQRRHQVVKNRSAMQISLRHVAGCARSFKQLIKAFQTLIADIDAQLKALMAQVAELDTARARLASISGIGPLISTALAVRLSRVHYASSDARVAALGLDPRPRDSGQMVGRRCWSKHGNAEERRLMYIAAVSAFRTKLWRPVVDKLSQRGFSKIAVHCIIARKLLRIALAVWNFR